MKLSEIHGEQCLDILADLIEPIAEIMSDKDIAKAAREKTRAAAVKIAIKNHKKAVIEIMAALEQKEPEEYAKEINLFILPAKVIEILNEPEIISLFQSQSQNADLKPFGSATENTEVGEM